MVFVELMELDSLAFLLHAVILFVDIGSAFPLFKLNTIITRNQRIKRPTNCKPILQESHSEDENPIIGAIVKVTKDINSRYFFPGHDGGLYAPQAMLNLYGRNVFHFDLPELDGLDNIHSPEGPLLQALALASKLFGARRTWFLVNGSTSGILAAILTCVALHRKLSSKSSVFLIGRDSHKAVFDALTLANCDAALLPCVTDEEFSLPLGVEFDTVLAALDTYGQQVNLLSILSFHLFISFHFNLVLSLFSFYTMIKYIDLTSIMELYLLNLTDDNLLDE